jgi:hypothetical protein
MVSLVASISLMWMASSWAGQMVDGHVHKAPHKGVIAHLGPHHVEWRVDRGKIVAWLLDEKLHVVPPANRALRAELEIDGAKKSLSLTARGDRFEVGWFVDSHVRMSGTLELTDGKKTFKGPVRWTALDARDRLDDTLGLDGQKL